MKRSAWTLSAALAAMLLGACTTFEIDKGQTMIAQGQVDQGLAELERISREHPGNAEARAAYMTQRIAVLAQLINDADTARIWGQYDAAEQLYKRALQIDPTLPGALNGLEQMAKDRRHDRLVAEGEMLAKSGDRAGAEAKARAVLAENPQHRGARALLRAVADQTTTVEVESPQLRAALRRPVTLEFRDANLRSVFEVISRTSGVNFVFDRDVRPDLRTTIFVRDTNLDDVIKLLLLTNQLDRKVVNDNSILIFPNTPAKQKEYQELVVRTFYLANADAKQAATLVRAVAKTRDLYIDEKLNLLVVKDTPAAMKLVEKLIASQDLGEPEVLLEVEVLEVGRSRLNELGFNPANQLQYGVGLGTSTGTGGTGTTTPSPLVPLTGGGFRWYIANPAAVLQLRGTDGSTNVLANPRIRVRNREKAKIHIGEKVPVITTTSTANVGVSSSVSYLDTGLKLDVEPNVYLQDEVAIKVQLEVSNIIEQLNINGTLAYRLGTRNTSTTLRLHDGETQMLAGLIQDSNIRTVTGLPYLSNVPLLNRLFDNSEQRTKTELVLLITPHIVRNVVRPDTVPAEFFSGTDARIGEPPMQLRPTGPGALSLAPSGVPGGPSASGRPVSPVTPPPATSGARETAEPTALAVSAPAQAVVGQEFVVTLALPARNQGANASIEVGYDPAVLHVVGREAPGAAGSPAGPDPGRALVAVNGSTIAGVPSTPTQVRFQVVAKAPTNTEIRIENVSAVDSSGRALPITAPSTLGLSIVQP